MSCRHRLIRLIQRGQLIIHWVFGRGYYYWWYVAIREADSFYVVFGEWGIMANSVIKDTGHAIIVVEPKDARGQTPPGVAPLEWTVADPSIAALKPAADGLSCGVWPAIPFKPGSTTVTATDPAHPHLAIQAWGFTFTTGDVVRYDSTVTVVDDAPAEPKSTENTEATTR